MICWPVNGRIRRFILLTLVPNNRAEWLPSTANFVLSDLIVLLNGVLVHKLPSAWQTLYGHRRPLSHDYLWIIPWLFLFVFTYLSHSVSLAYSVLYALVLMCLLEIWNVCVISFTLPYYQYLDTAGIGCLPSDVSPDEVHSSVFKSTKALYINTHDR